MELGRILAADIMGKGPESESYSDGVLVPCGVTEFDWVTKTMGQHGHANPCSLKVPSLCCERI